MRIVYSQCSCYCEAQNIEVYFKYNNSVVFDTEEKIVGDDGEVQEIKKYLSIITKCELEQYLSSVEINRYSREDNLIIQGIITFFTGSPLTIYDNDSSYGGVTPVEYEEQETHLRINGVDYSADLVMTLDRLGEKPDLIATLLDRWRKAIYLLEESCDADLYYDEAILSFFHIFELLGESIGDELKRKLECNIENMLCYHFRTCCFKEKKAKEMVEQNKKTIKSLLVGEYVNLAIKIKYFLEKYELLDDNVAFFIDNMIKVRNKIAHGRITYQKKFMWPLPPFFNLSKDSYENVDFLLFLSAVMISKYIGIKRWEQEWDERKLFLMPPDDIIKGFLDGELVIENFNDEMLLTGNEFNITWRTIFYYYVKKPTQAMRVKLENTLKGSFINTDIDENSAPDIFNISIIFADSADGDIKNRAIDNIKTILSNSWHGWSNFKDALTYLDYYSVPVTWYKEFLQNGTYLELRA